MDDDDSVDMILVERLALLYDVWNGLGIDPVKREDLPNVAQEHMEPLERGLDYHIPRVAFFVKEIEEGRTVSPIDLDNLWSGWWPLGIVLEDGHHRLAAAILTQTTRIPCVYSGIVDALEWLKGEGSIEDPPF